MNGDILGLYRQNWYQNPIHNFLFYCTLSCYCGNKGKKSYNYKLPDVNIVSSFHLHVHLLLRLEPGKVQSWKITLCVCYRWLQTLTFPCWFRWKMYQSRCLGSRLFQCLDPDLKVCVLRTWGQLHFKAKQENLILGAIPELWRPHRTLSPYPSSAEDDRQPEGLLST